MHACGLEALSFLRNRNHKRIKQILKRKCDGRYNENRMLPGRRGPFQHAHSFPSMSLLDIKPIKQGSAQTRSLASHGNAEGLFGFSDASSSSA